MLVSDIVYASGPIDVDELLLDVGDEVRSDQSVLTTRTGTETMSGADVRQLEEVLVELGFEPGAVDGTFDADTEAAVTDWQTSIGADPDGVVDLGDVVTRSAPIRITDVVTSPGGAVHDGVAVLATSSADIEVILDSREDVLRLPSYALLEGGRVLIVDDGKLTEVDVETGLRNWDATEILSGLSEGDPVVVSLDRQEVKAGVRAEVVDEIES